MKEKQIAALKFFVFKSRLSKDFAKRIFAFLLDASKGLTEGVCICLEPDENGYSDEAIFKAAWDSNGLRHQDGDVHVDHLLACAGSDFTYFFQGGYDHRRKKQTGSRVYTFWLANWREGKDAKVIPVTKEQLEAINVESEDLSEVIFQSSATEEPKAEKKEAEQVAS